MPTAARLLFLNRMTPEQQQLIELAARVPSENVAAAKRMLESLIVDPFWLDLRAVSEDELTPEEQAAIEEARESIRRGEPLISHEEILREFGM